jgi:hypothetical protein
MKGSKIVEFLKLYYVIKSANGRTESVKMYPNVTVKYEKFKHETVERSNVQWIGGEKQNE